MAIKVEGNEVTLDFTKDNEEGYAARLALGYLVHDLDSFSPEEAQRISMLLDTIDEAIYEENRRKQAEAMAQDQRDLERDSGEGC